VDDEAGAIEFCHRLALGWSGPLSLLCGSAGVAEELTQEALAVPGAIGQLPIGWENRRPRFVDAVLNRLQVRDVGMAGRP
jgi:hypothetical protein